MYIIRMIRIKTAVFISHDNFLENSFKIEKCNSFDIIEKIHQQDKFRDLRNFQFGRSVFLTELKDLGQNFSSNKKTSKKP